MAPQQQGLGASRGGHDDVRALDGFVDRGADGNLPARAFFHMPGEVLGLRAIHIVDADFPRLRAGHEQRHELRPSLEPAAYDGDRPGILLGEVQGRRPHVGPGADGAQKHAVHDRHRVERDGIVDDHQRRHFGHTRRADAFGGDGDPLDAPSADVPSYPAGQGVDAALFPFRFHAAPADDPLARKHGFPAPVKPIDFFHERHDLFHVQDARFDDFTLGKEQQGMRSVSHCHFSNYLKER